MNLDSLSEGDDSSGSDSQCSHLCDRKSGAVIEAKREEGMVRIKNGYLNSEDVFFFNYFNLFNLFCFFKMLFFNYS